MMMQTAEYDAGAKSFHGATVALLGSQFVIGWIMPSVSHIAQPAGLISLHFSLGIVILGLPPRDSCGALPSACLRPQRACPTGSIDQRNSCTWHSTCCCLHWSLAAGATPQVTVLS